jgi:hypothetical protein
VIPLGIDCDSADHWMPLLCPMNVTMESAEGAALQALRAASPGSSLDDLAAKCNPALGEIHTVYQGTFDYQEMLARHGRLAATILAG